jgi:carnitine O-palmitoyltransferase 1
MGMSEESAFLKTALTQPWRLSTSQTPYKQTDVWDLLPDHLSHHACSGGGFGPVADDGYGCSYLVAGENRFYFHVTSKKSSPFTSSSRFSQHLKVALSDMRSLLR